MGRINCHHSFVPSFRRSSPQKKNTIFGAPKHQAAGFVGAHAVWYCTAPNCMRLLSIMTSPHLPHFGRVDRLYASTHCG